MNNWLRLAVLSVLMLGCDGLIFGAGDTFEATLAEKIAAAQAGVKDPDNASDIAQGVVDGVSLGLSSAVAEFTLDLDEDSEPSTREYPLSGATDLTSGGTATWQEGSLATVTVTETGAIDLSVDGELLLENLVFDELFAPVSATVILVGTMNLEDGFAVGEVQVEALIKTTLDTGDVLNIKMIATLRLGASGDVTVDMTIDGETVVVTVNPIDPVGETPVEEGDDDDDDDDDGDDDDEDDNEENSTPEIVCEGILTTADFVANVTSANTVVDFSSINTSDTLPNPFTDVLVCYIPDGQQGYNVYANRVTAYPLRSTVGTEITLGDDDSVVIDCNETYPFYGITFNTFRLHSAGGLLLNLSSDFDTSSVLNIMDMATVDEMNYEPAIVFAGADLDPTEGGSIRITESTTEFVVTFDDIREYDEPDSRLDVQVVYKLNGAIAYAFGEVAGSTGQIIEEMGVGLVAPDSTTTTVVEYIPGTGLDGDQGASESEGQGECGECVEPPPCFPECGGQGEF